MIKELEIIDFENHKKSKFSFKDGFNLICGKSDSGKTSIIRALRLVLYNQWSPESLRIGSKNCKITLVTEEGKVSVTKGKDNTWEITDKEGNSKIFKKIGKDILPEVMEITKIKPVKLGSCDAMPNIMNQLEGHFLLSEVDGENVSGSLRAQIVDEISGLSGMEGLIRELSLDNLRNAKKIKEIEIINEGLNKKLHDEDQLKEEIKRINNVEKLFNEFEKHEKDKKEISEFSEKYLSIIRNLNRLQLQYDGYKNLEKTLLAIKRFNEFFNKWDGAKEFFLKYSGQKVQLFKLQKSLSKVDYDEILILSNKFQVLSKKRSEVKGILKKYLNLHEQLKKLIKNTSGVDYNNILDIIEKLEDDIDKTNEVKKFLKEYKSGKLNLARQKKVLKDTVIKLEQKNEQYLSELKSVKVCPLTGRPTKESCFEDL